jgi:hypothetical protein
MGLIKNTSLKFHGAIRARIGQACIVVLEGRTKRACPKVNITPYLNIGFVSTDHPTNLHFALNQWILESISKFDKTTPEVFTRKFILSIFTA